MRANTGRQALKLSQVEFLQSIEEKLIISIVRFINISRIITAIKRARPLSTSICIIVCHVSIPLFLTRSLPRDIELFLYYSILFKNLCQWDARLILLILKYFSRTRRILDFIRQFSNVSFHRITSVQIFVWPKSNRWTCTSRIATDFILNRKVRIRRRKRKCTIVCMLISKWKIERNRIFLY